MEAIRRHPPANLAGYLWAVLVQIPALWVARAWWGDESWRYAVAYIGFTSVILGAISRVTWDCLRFRAHRFRAGVSALILAAVLTKAARMDMHGQWAWISLAEGFLLLWMGILTAYAGALRRGWEPVYVPLGMFWVLQGGYSLGWAIHGELWSSINWLVPPLLGCACFSYLAVRLKAAA